MLHVRIAVRQIYYNVYNFSWQLLLNFICIQELNSPILYLDVMRWCWQQDYHHRPSAAQLSTLLPNPALPRLVDAVSLNNSSLVTCSCICTLPIEILPPGELGEDPTLPPHPHVARGDLTEELWLCTHGSTGSEVRVINFRGKASQVSWLKMLKLLKKGLKARKCLIVVVDLQVCVDVHINIPHTHTYAHTHTCIHPHTYAHTHIHTHAYAHTVVPCMLCQDHEYLCRKLLHVGGDR